MHLRRPLGAALLLAVAASYSIPALTHRADGDWPAGIAGIQDDRPAPRIRLIATGGTISVGAAGRLTAPELLASIPLVHRFAQPEPEQFSNTTSTALTLRDWLDLARRLNDLFRDDPGLSGAVVSTGTDTLEETAYFLNLTVRTDRPVVVVGSMRNASTHDYDGPANLLAAFRVAADPEARGRGVLVVMNDEINTARDVTKTDSASLDTFQARSDGALGTVDGDRIHFHHGVTKRHTASSEFDISRIQELPRVDIVLVYQDASGDLIRALVDRGARGVVVAAAGAGSTSGTQNEGLAYAESKGVVVAISTRTGSGPISPPGRLAVQYPGRTAPRVSAGDLAPLKARVLLMLALTVTSDTAEIQRMFGEY